MFSTLIIIRNVSRAAYYYDFWRSCDTEENTALITEINYSLTHSHRKQILYTIIIFHCICDKCSWEESLSETQSLTPAGRPVVYKLMLLKNRWVCMSMKYFPALCVSLCVNVCVCVRVSVCVWERERVCVCVCVWEREREREREREGVCVRVSVCVCERERERANVLQNWVWSLRWQSGSSRLCLHVLSELYLSTVSVRPLTSQVRMSFHDRLTGSVWFSALFMLDLFSVEEFNAAFLKAVLNGKTFYS